MVFNYALKIFNFIPKWLLIAAVACGVSYLVGKSHGREPYKAAEKILKEKLKVAVKTKVKNSEVVKNEKKVSKQLEGYECIITGDIASLLSNVK